MANAANNIGNGDRDALEVAVYNEAEVQVPLPPLLLPVGMSYGGAPPDTTASTVPIVTIVGGQTSNL